MTEAIWRQRYRAPTMSLPQWARDAPDRTIYVTNISGKQEIHAWDRATDVHRQVTDRVEGTTSAAISPDGETIWWFDDRKGDELGVWALEPYAGGEARHIDLRPGYGSGLVLGSTLAVMGTSAANVHAVHVVDADGSERPRQLYEHGEAVRLAGMSRDESLVALLHSEHGDSRNRALRVVDLDGVTVAERWEGTGKGINDAVWSRVEGDQRLLFVHEPEGRNRPAIWSPLDDEVTELRIDDLEGEIDAAWYPDGAAVLLDQTFRGRSRLYRYDLATHQMDEIDVGRGVVMMSRVHPSGDLWYSISRSSTPTAVHCGDQVVRPMGAAPAPGGVAFEDLEVDEIHGFVARPTEGRAPWPTVFQVHGGPAGADMDWFSAGTQAWVDHGFQVVMVNYRGSSGYGKAWRDALVGKPGLCELEDLAAVRAHLVEAGLADPARMILHGGSWGGYLTLLGLGRQPDLWSLGISVVPLADLASHYHQQSDPLKAYWRALFGGTPETLGAELDEISPITFAADLAVPLLIQTGDNDPRCPIRQVLTYVARCEAEGKDVELYRYDAGHGSVRIDEQLALMEMRLAFAAKHLGTAAPL